MSRKAKFPDLSNIDKFLKFLNRVINLDHAEGINATYKIEADGKAMRMQRYGMHISSFVEALGIRRSDVYALVFFDMSEEDKSQSDPFLTTDIMRLFEVDPILRPALRVIKLWCSRLGVIS